MQKTGSSKVAEIFHVSGFKLTFAAYPFSFFGVCKVVQRRAKQSVACCSSPLAQASAELQILGIWDYNQRNYPCACPVFTLFPRCLLLEEGRVDLRSEPV